MPSSPRIKTGSFRLLTIWFQLYGQVLSEETSHSCVRQRTICKCAEFTISVGTIPSRQRRSQKNHRRDKGPYQSYLASNFSKRRRNRTGLPPYCGVLHLSGI